MTYAEFKVQLDAFRAECRDRDRRWYEKHGRPDPKAMRERLAKLIADLEQGAKA